MEKILKKEKLREWIGMLEHYDMHAPVFNDAIWGFARLEPGDLPDLTHTNTVGSVKAFSFPQREVFFCFDRDETGQPLLRETLPETKSTLVFGVRPCDGRGMLRNDTVFSKEFNDPYYWARRNNLTLIGLACGEPHSPNCFCQAVGGSPNSEEGLDVLMTDLGDRFFVKGITPRGVEIIEQGRAAFDETQAKDAEDRHRLHTESMRHPQRRISDQEGIADAIRRQFDAPLWDEMARHCLGCGICTFLCPTCHCFDINDEERLPNSGQGERVRTWDNCQFPDFTCHTSGHNPRDSLGQRLRQRISHKFLYFVENHQTQQCTGCGRCISECPVGIDILAVLEKVVQS